MARNALGFGPRRASGGLPGLSPAAARSAGSTSPPGLAPHPIRERGTIRRQIPILGHRYADTRFHAARSRAVLLPEPVRTPPSPVVAVACRPPALSTAPRAGRRKHRDHGRCGHRGGTGEPNRTAPSPHLPVAAAKGTHAPQRRRVPDMPFSGMGAHLARARRRRPRPRPGCPLRLLDRSRRRRCRGHRERLRPRQRRAGPHAHDPKSLTRAQAADAPADVRLLPLKPVRPTTSSPPARMRCQPFPQVSGPRGC